MIFIIVYILLSLRSMMRWESMPLYHHFLELYVWRIYWCLSDIFLLLAHSTIYYLILPSSYCIMSNGIHIKSLYGRYKPWLSKLFMYELCSSSSSRSEQLVFKYQSIFFFLRLAILVLNSNQLLHVILCGSNVIVSIFNISLWLYVNSLPIIYVYMLPVQEEVRFQIYKCLCCIFHVAKQVSK